MENFLLNEDLGVRVLNDGYSLNIQLQFSTRWVTIDSYRLINNQEAFIAAKNSFNIECERRKKQNEDNRNHVRDQKQI